MSKIRLFLADDHAILRAGLKSLLSNESDMEVVGEASNGHDAVQMVCELAPDVALMDITMPGMSGLDAARQIRKLRPGTKVLMLTMHDDEEYLFQALEAGSSGYIVKKLADTELIMAIRDVHSGAAFVNPSMARSLVEDYLDRVKAGEEESSYKELTDREREVLTLVADGYTNQEIANLLVLSVKTVETHRSHIMDKLGLQTRAQLVKYARRKGLYDYPL